MSKLIDFAKRLDTVEGSFVTIKEDNSPDTMDSNEQLLDYIYALDPKTSMPSGDLAVYLGDKANPEIRNFIELNLLNPQNIETGSKLPTEITNKFKEISDDDVAFFSRRHGESREEYADRIKLFFVQEKQRRRQEGHLKDLEKILKNKDE